MKGYNSVVISGKIYKSAEMVDEDILQFKVVSIRLVKNKKERTEREDPTQFIVQIHHEKSEIYKNILLKDIRVIVAGSLKLHTWIDDNKKKQSIHIIIVDSIQYGDYLIDTKD